MKKAAFKMKENPLKKLVKSKGFRKTSSGNLTMMQNVMNLPKRKKDLTPQNLTQSISNLSDKLKNDLSGLSKGVNNKISKVKNIFKPNKASNTNSNTTGKTYRAPSNAVADANAASKAFQPSSPKFNIPVSKPKKRSFGDEKRGSKIIPNKPGALETEIIKNKPKATVKNQGALEKQIVKNVKKVTQGPKNTTLTKSKKINSKLKTSDLSNTSINTGKKIKKNKLAVSNNKVKVKTKRKSGESQYQFRIRLKAEQKKIKNKNSKSKVDLTKKTGLGPRA